MKRQQNGKTIHLHAIIMPVMTRKNWSTLEDRVLTNSSMVSLAISADYLLRPVDQWKMLENKATNPTGITVDEYLILR